LIFFTSLHNASDDVQSELEIEIFFVLDDADFEVRVGMLGDFFFGYFSNSLTFFPILKGDKLG
jgi:hypothetical protein